VVWLATTFVAKFIGSLALSLLELNDVAGNGATSVRLNDAAIDVPEILSGTNGKLTFGVRPEHVHLDDAAPYRGRIIASEYLGTTQIITFDTPLGAVKARIKADVAVRIGEVTGLRFDSRSISLFAPNGHALLSKANQKVLSHG